jgi:hypothetical protein
LVPSASATQAAVTEDFESYANFTAPTGAGKGYTFSGTGVVTAPPVGSPGGFGSHSLKQVASVNPSNSDFLFTTSICASGTPAASAPGFSIAVYIDAYPPASNFIDIGTTDTANALGGGGGATDAQFYFKIDSVGQLFAYRKLGAGAATQLGLIDTVPVDEWFTLSLVCGSATMVWHHVDTGNFVSASTGASTTTTCVPGVNCRFKMNVAANTGHVFLDNFVYQRDVPASGARFCANPASPPLFEYEYVSDWTFEDFSSLDRDLDSAFQAETLNTETAYMGKGFTTGSRAFETVASIEAAAEGTPSLFAIAYTKGTGGLPSAATDGTGLESTGLDGGNFDDSLQVVFREDGNDWNIGIYENIAGTVARLGAAVAHGNPNDPTTYRFRIDTRTQIARLLDAEGALIFERNMAGGTADDVFKDQWFAASGEVGLFTNTATTFLDDPDQVDEEAQDSTCIFDLEGTSVVNGGSGLQPPSEIPNNPPDEPDPDSNVSDLPLGIDPTAGANALGVSEAAYGAYLGIMYTLAIGVVFAIPAAVVAVKFQKSLIIVAWSFLAGVVLGFILTAVWGFYEAWMVFAVVLAMILAVIGLIVLGRRGG